MDELYNLSAEYSFGLVVTALIFIQGFLFWYNYRYINRNVPSGDQLMDAYIMLRAFREGKNTSHYRQAIPPEERVKLANSLLRLDESRKQ